MYHTPGHYKMYQYWLIQHDGHQYDSILGGPTSQSTNILVGPLYQVGLTISCGTVLNLQNLCHEI